MLDFLKENKETVTVFVFVALVLVTLVIIILIWNNQINPKSEYDTDVNVYSSSYDYVDVQANYYSSILTRVLKEVNFDELYESIDVSFLSNNNLNEENLKEYLVSNGFIGSNPTISEYSVSNTSDYVYYYRYTYSVDGKTNYVNVIESVPGEYKISFEQGSAILTSKTSEIEGISNGIEYQISLIESSTEYVRYAIKLKNTNDQTVFINFNKFDTFQIKVGDEIYNLSSVVAQEGDFSLTRGSIINRDILFSIDQEMQDNVTGLIINNIKLDTQDIKMEINF